MSFYNFGSISSQLQFIGRGFPGSQGHNSTNVFRFRLYNICKPVAQNVTHRDTMVGFIRVASEFKYTFIIMLKQFDPSLDLTDAWIVQRLVKQDNSDIFRITKDRNLIFNSEPVLIDTDYITQDLEFLAQICIQNADRILDSPDNHLPDLEFEVEVFYPNPKPIEYIYNQPLFGAMRPEYAEEFLDVNLFKELVIPDFTFIRGSKGAIGFDIMPRAVVDNSKDFDDGESLAEAVRKRIVVPALYSVELLFPNFFNHFGEYNDMPNMFMLRSRIAKSNMALQYRFVEGRNLKLVLHNCNYFDVVLTEDPEKANELPIRFAQFVPPPHLRSKINSFTDANELAQFLGIVLILNEKERKSKV
jgi:hypothetical protein